MLKIGAAATQHGVSLWTVIAQPPLFGVAIAKATVNKLGAFCQLVEGWRARLGTDDAYELGKTIVQESGVALDIYSNRDPEDLARQENLQEFMADESSRHGSLTSCRRWHCSPTSTATAMPTHRVCR